MSKKRVFCSAAAAAVAFLGASSVVFAQAAATPAPAPGASIPASIGYAYTYTVNAAASADPATTPAASGATFKTLARALSDAIARKNASGNVVVNIRPGTYYESIEIPASTNVTNDTAWLTIQRAPGFSGAVVVSGATETLPDNSAWNTGWTNVGNGIWRHAWPYNWTLSPVSGNYPSYYDGGPNLSSVSDHGPDVYLTRRKELVFVGNTLLRQVGSTTGAAPTTLPDGSFHLNVNTAATDNNGRPTHPPAAPPNRYVYINPPGTTNPNGASVEVALRETGMRINKRRNVVLKNLDFTRVTGYQDDSDAGFGLSINNGCVNVLVEDCRAYHNNHTGMKFSNGLVNAVTIRRTNASENGVLGMFGWYADNIRAEDSITNRNNFRGDWGGFISGAAPAGFKFLHTRGTSWIRHTANNNWARGMWWDSDNTDVYVESCFMDGNVWSGMFIEYSQGPFLVKRCVISNTRLAGEGETPQFIGGLLMSTCNDVTLQSNILHNNASWQMRILNTPRRTDAVNRDTRESLPLSPRRFSFENNVLLASGADQVALSFPPNETGPSAMYPYTDIYATMDSGVNTATSGPNCFWNWSRSDLYGTTADASFLLTTRSLADWRTYSGQERASIQQTPGFVDPTNNNYTLNSGSPVAGWNLPTAPLQ